MIFALCKVIHYLIFVLMNVFNKFDVFYGEFIFNKFISERKLNI